MAQHKARPQPLGRKVWRYSLAAVAVTAALGFRLTLEAWVGPGLPTYITFYPAVMAVALLAGFGPGLVATALAGFVVAYWILPPAGYRVASPIEQVGLMLFTGMGLFMSLIAEFYRRNRDKAAAYDRESALRANEERLRLALEAARLATWDWNIASGNVVWNDQHYRQLGYKPGTIQPTYKAWADRVHPDDLPAAEAKIRHVMEQGGDYVNHFRTLWPDGTVRFLDVLGRFERDAAGKAVRLYGAMLDVTERVRAEEELQKLASVVRYSRDFINVATLDGKMIFINEAGANMVGLSAEEVEQTHILQVIPDNLKDKVKHEVLPTLKEKGFWEGELQYCNLKTGWLTDVYATTFSVKDPDKGTPLFLANTSIDITWRKRAEEALRESEARFKVIASSTPDHLLVQDFDLRYTLVVNPQLGLTEKDMIGKTDYDFLKKEDAENLTKIKRQVLETGRTVHVELPIISPEGKAQFFSGSYVPKHDAAGQIDGLIGYFKNVTDRRRMEETLRVSEEALRRANESLEQEVQQRTADLVRTIDALQGEVEQRQSIEQALRDANEQLANRAAQLRALAGELTLAEQRERRHMAKVLHDHLQQLLVGAKFRAAILGRAGDEVIKNGAAEIEELLDESIDASRSLTAELSPPVLHEGGLLPGLGWLARWMAAKHGLAVDLSMEQDIPPLAEDVKVLLFESVRELLFNAVKHARVHSASVIVRLIEGKALHITVSDMGPGFDPSGLKPPGTAGGGFGLFSIRERLDLIGGRLDIDSAPGKGCRFVLISPIVDAVVASPKPVAMATAPDAGGRVTQVASLLPGTKIRVLLADDHAVLRQGLASLLGAEPDIEIVGQVSDGQAAVQAAGKLQPDVILMDMSMPKLNGVEATRAIHSDYPDIRIIGLTMFEESEHVQAMRDAGAVQCLTKSGPAVDLLAGIRNGGRTQ